MCFNRVKVQHNRPKFHQVEPRGQKGLYRDLGRDICLCWTYLSWIYSAVLGIKERNGITSLGGLIARMITVYRELVLARYHISHLLQLGRLVVNIANILLPFNNCVTGSSVFYHKAGIHTKVILSDIATYTILRPEDFGLKIYMEYTARLTGWNSIKL